MDAVVVVRQQTGLRARTTTELGIVLMLAEAALHNQLAVGKVRIVLAVVRNVGAGHVDLLRMVRRTELVLCRTAIVAGIGGRGAVDQHPMRVGDLDATVRAQLDAVLRPGDVGRRIAGDVTGQRNVRTDGERVAAVQDDVDGDGNWANDLGLVS